LKARRIVRERHRVKREGAKAYRKSKISLCASVPGEVNHKVKKRPRAATRERINEYKEGKP